MKFEWDEKKNITNVEKQGLNFEDAKDLFINGTLYCTVDNRKDYGEIRYSGLDYINGRLLNVVFTKRHPDIIRIISFRKANNREKKRFEKSR
ncbi:MAG TPA: BrnT family toxin [Aquella sp.]|nr:BrnT family toxin [Aquella sp.]